ncbi:SLC13 family permease [Hydrogenovibrio sp. SC-1]|uniref:SLC13 family permease n=1 Tax=Hydrogenovibrio sp. SC-1 TaxID=2065820 RepID=UPI000C7CA27D|nr:SLC13 family permease [Hydrogenovibrio sp. SC-1]PLA74658.1 SLC13 family permease [Hydrogenovibrio sp. SC-1]
MEWQGWFSLLLTGAVLLVLVFTKAKPHFVMMSALTLLSVSGILSIEESLAGFSNPGLITVAAMFVLAAGVYASGGIDLIVNTFLGNPKSERGALLRIFLPVSVLSGFLNNTPVVATMIPAIHLWARKINIAPSKLLIPLSYTAILGGTLTMIGTSTNLVINGQYQSLTGEAGFSLFDITLIGLPVAIAGLVFMWWFFPKWLPNRSDQKMFSNFREFTLEVLVSPQGPLVGKTIQSAGLRDLNSLYLVEIEREGSIITAVSSEEKLKGNDRLVFAGDTQAISDLLRINGLEAPLSEGNTTLDKESAERRIVEAVVSPSCEAVGYAIRDVHFRNRYGAVILAVARNGERIKGNLGNIKLEAGDTLLLEARPAFVSRQRYNRDFLLINEHDQARLRHDRAYIALAILVGVVITASFGILSMLHATLLGAGLMVISGACTVAQAEKGLDLPVIITIAAAFALGAALNKTGAADLLAQGMIELSFGQAWLLLVLTYFTVSVLTEMITNNAAAVLMLPIILEMTDKLSLNNEPFIFAIMMAASASFATPLGYQTNLMVYGPGGYTVKDFLKVGLPMNLFIGLVTLSILLIGWPLSV